MTQRSAESATNVYLGRIKEQDAKYGAFIHVDEERALTHARAVDALSASGNRLGALHGKIVALKDLLTVEAMPTYAGSEVPIDDIVPPEGPFVRALRAAGCVFIGKTRSTEFALGAYNLERRTPWNPCDSEVHRMPGGSSNGSAVATAAEMCDFAIGSDTGGSVRLPAALCGIVGYRPSPGVWSTDGVFPLSPLLDTLGPLTRHVHDTITIFETLAQQQVPKARIERLRFGRPTRMFEDDLDDDVRHCMNAAIAKLEESGARIDPVDVPETDLVDPVFAKMITADLVATLGRERVERYADRLDPVVRDRIRGGLEISASDYVTMVRRCGVLAAAAKARMQGFDAWITPTTPSLPIPVSECQSVEAAAAWNRRSLRNTRPGNVFAMCGVSLPVGNLGSALPVGLQLLAACGEDAKLLAVARAVEEALA